MKSFILVLFFFSCNFVSTSFGFAGSPVASPSGSPPSIATPDSAAVCAGDQVAIYKFAFSDPRFRKKYDLVVFNDGYKKIDQVVAELKSKGMNPISVVNGGFFELDESRIYSYFKSTTFHRELNMNSNRSPRACMIWKRAMHAFSLRESTDQNYREFKTIPDTEIYCAGPQLVDAGKDVSLKRYCSEQFDPKCRPDHTDPGVQFNTAYPRTGSCYTQSGDFIVFAAISDRQQCGISEPVMAQKMIQQQCAYGMSHDGGGSAKFYHDSGTGKPTWMLGYGDDQNRAVPTWIAIVQRQAK